MHGTEQVSDRGSVEGASIVEVQRLLNEARQVIISAAMQVHKKREGDWKRSAESIAGYIMSLSYRVERLGDLRLARVILDAAHCVSQTEPRCNIAIDLIMELRRDPRIYKQSAGMARLTGFYAGALTTIFLTVLLWVFIHVVSAAEHHLHNADKIYGLPLDRYVLAAASGVAGAFVALTREPDAEGAPKLQGAELIIFEVRRPIVGYVLGLTALAAVSAGLIPLSTSANTAPFWTALLGFAAGLSGEFALSLTKRIERAA